MATEKNTANNESSLSQREWRLFALASYTAIVMRKHDVAVPPFDATLITDEELERRIRLLSELAHLPPA